MAFTGMLMLHNKLRKRRICANRLYHAVYDDILAIKFITLILSALLLDDAMAQWPMGVDIIDQQNKYQSVCRI